MTQQYDPPSLAELRKERDRDPEVIDAVLASLHGTSLVLRLSPDNFSDWVSQQMLVATTNLAARIFPRLGFDLPAEPFTVRAPHLGDGRAADALANLAKAINPEVDLSISSSSPLVLEIGAPQGSTEGQIRIDADGWDVFLRSGPSENPTLPMPRRRHPSSFLLAASIGVTEALQTAVPHVLGNPATALTLNTWDYAQIGKGPEIAEPLPIQPLSLIGLGSLGSAVVYLLGCWPRLTGKLTVIDRDTVGDENRARYILAATAETGEPKTAWAAKHLQRHGALDVQQVHDDVKNWSRGLAKGKRLPYVMITPDNVPARREAADALPRIAFSATINGSTCWINRSHFAATMCSYCKYTKPAGGDHFEKRYAQATGIDLDRVKQLMGTDGDPNRPSPMTRRDTEAIERRLGDAAGSLSKWHGKRLTDFLQDQEHRLYASARLSGEKGTKSGATLPLPIFGAATAAFMVSEFLKDIVPGGRAAEFDWAEVTFNPLTRTLARATPLRDPSHTCLCRDPARARWHRDIYPEDETRLSTWISIGANSSAR